MIEFNKEYFKKPFYFLLKDKGDKISVYYSVSDTINEAKETNDVVEIPKENTGKLKTFVSKVMKNGSVPSTDYVVKKLKSYKETAVKEAKETRLLVKIIMKVAKSYLKDKDFKLDDEDKDFIKDQSKDIVKLIPIIALQVFPGSSVVTPFLVELGNKLGIKLTSKVPEKYKEEKTEKEGGEIDELVDDDGSPLGSNIPILQQNMHPNKTLDQTVRMTRASQYPFVRVYYGESEEKDGKVIDEENMSDAFGYDETEDDTSYKECMETMKEMGIDDVFERNERCRAFGFEKKYDNQLKNEKNRGKCKNCFTKRRLSELEKEKMENLLDEILLSKKKKDNDVVKNKDTENEDSNPIENILIKNLESVAKIADKEGIDLNKLIKHLKKSEQ
jgi:hypothetical protein